ncbi:MAG: MBL fold metallo-hydrolase [Planctomycetota bacterium]
MTSRSIELAGLALEVISVAGIESALIVPAYKVAVDLGRGGDQVVQRRNVFLTHAHIDHLGGIAHHVGLRALRRLPPPTYFVPAPIAARVERVLDAWRELQEDALPAEVRGLAVNERVTLRKDLEVVTFATDHRVPSLGYHFVERTRRLRRELVGEPGHVLAARRAAGEELEDTHERVELTVAGDSTIDALLASPAALTSKRLVMEVTFLDDRVSVEDARRKGHTHLAEVAQHAHLFENEALLLCHVSTRYSALEARALVEARLPSALFERCTLIAGDGP